MNSENDDKPDDDLGIRLDALPDREGRPPGEDDGPSLDQWPAETPAAEPQMMGPEDEPLDDDAILIEDDHLPLRCDASPEPDTAHSPSAGGDAGEPMESAALAMVASEMPAGEAVEDEFDLPSRLHQIQAQMASLQREFEGKIKYDAHKDTIIDRLHDELQEYKQDFLKKHLLSVILDVIKIADDIRKWLHHFRSLEPAQRDPLKLFRYLEAIPTDLEDVFYWHGVKPFSSPEGGAFDPTRQRAVKKVSTEDAAKDKMVARSLRPGYVWDDKVIRQEMVAVYVHDDGSQPETTRNDND